MSENQTGHPPVNTIGDVDSVYANYMHAWIQGNMVRLTYGEAAGNTGVRFHSAVSLTKADAITFANLVLQLIADYDKQYATPPAQQAP